MKMTSWSILFVTLIVGATLTNVPFAISNEWDQKKFDESVQQELDKTGLLLNNPANRLFQFAYESGGKQQALAGTVSGAGCTSISIENSLCEKVGVFVISDKKQYAIEFQNGKWFLTPDPFKLESFEGSLELLP